MKDELTLLAARADDLYKAALKNGISAGDFLSPAEQSYLQTLEGRSFPQDTLIFFGGYRDAERCVPIFKTENYKNDFGKNTKIDWDAIDWEKDDWWEQTESLQSISDKNDVADLSQAGLCVICLTVPKGAELPGHRDCLGTLMGLGLERRAVGDIVCKEDAVYLFVKDTVAPYLLNSLSRVGKSPVRAEICELPADFSCDRAYERLELTLASLRADVFVAAIAGCSREEAKNQVTAGLLRRNHLPLCDPQCQLTPGDLISVQHKGRYRFLEIAGQTKKGRLKVILQKYI